MKETQEAKNKRIAKRFLSDPTPCGPSNDGIKYKSDKKYKVVLVDELSIFKK